MRSADSISLAAAAFAAMPGNTVANSMPFDLMAIPLSSTFLRGSVPRRPALIRQPPLGATRAAAHADPRRLERRYRPRRGPHLLESRGENLEAAVDAALRAGRPLAVALRPLEHRDVVAPGEPAERDRAERHAEEGQRGHVEPDQADLLDERGERDAAQEARDERGMGLDELSLVPLAEAVLPDARGGIHGEAGKPALVVSGFGRLAVGVIARAHHWPACGVHEAHLPGLFLEHAELVRMRVACHGQAVLRRLQVLADREHVDAVRAQVAHHGEDLVVGLP